MEKNEKIAITGSTGSIGIEFPKNCKKLFTRLESSKEKMIQELMRFNKKPDTVIHLAALVSTKKCEENYDHAYNLNVKGAIKWFEACKYVGIKNFIFVSTSHVYKPIDNFDVKIGIFFDKQPPNNYGKTKLEAEKKLVFLSKYEGYPRLVIARVFSVFSYNVRKDFLIYELLNRKKNKIFTELKGINIQRDFLTSKKISNQLVQITKSKNKKKIYHICSGKGLKIKEICLKILGKKFYEKCKKIDDGDTKWKSMIGRYTPIN